MIRAFLHRFRHVPWLLTGVLLFACYPPVSKQVYIVFALVPLLLMVRHMSPKFCLKWGFLSGFLFWFATLKWLFPLKDMMGNPTILILLGWAALAAYCALYFGLFGYLAASAWSWANGRIVEQASSPAQLRNLKNPHPEEAGTPPLRGEEAGTPPLRGEEAGTPPLRGEEAGRLLYGKPWRRLVVMLIAEPLLWAGLELIRSRFGTGFAWNHLGTVPAVMGLGAPAALGGVYLLSVLVVLMNGSVASIVERCYQSLVDFYLARHGKTDAAENRPAALPRWMRSVETLAPFVLVFAVYLSARAVVATEPMSADPVSVALLQRNFPPPFTDRKRQVETEGAGAGAATSSMSPYQIYRDMAADVKALKPDLLVLSESAMTEFSGDVTTPRARGFADALMQASGATAVIAGGARETADKKTYNSAALYQETVQTYDKVHLVPFGEYVPGASLLPALEKLLPFPSCTPGEVRTVAFTLPSSIPDVPAQEVPIGVGICYEDTDSALMRQLAEKGARLLVFITNDSWFYESDEPEQHAWQAVARSIETGLPVVRVGNYGVTGFIEPHGARGRQCRARWLRNPDGTLKVNARERMVCDVTLANALPEFAATPYVRWGDKPLAVAFLLLIFTMGVIKYRSTYEKRRKLSL